ncbi:aliphatic nitrilase [Lipomyces kononenkoae]|uniref:Aliphatic nitrilase n=1 Tax=Lipomyces kononenkoae TaxID=34357 RepID=A0ACC3T2Q2_LIPKO
MARPEHMWLKDDVVDQIDPASFKDSNDNGFGDHSLPREITRKSVTRVAACHVAPVFLSARRTAEKAVSLIYEAAKNGANVVVFPETYIPAFPIWSALRSPAENHDFFKKMVKESIYADGEEIQAIRSAARATKAIVSIGISERASFSAATLYNSNLLIAEDGEIMVHHRKLMPTFFEKLTWAPGDGHGLQVAETQHGKIGNLICGENTNPLARYSLMAQGEQIHISTWPSVWPTRVLARMTSSENEEAPLPVPIAGRGTNYDNVAANRTRAAAHCFEAKCFGVLCSSFLDQHAIETIAANSYAPDVVSESLQLSPRGVTMFLDPTGAPFPSFIVTPQSGEHESKDFLQTEEGVLYADMDLDDCIEGKQYHDVVGGYQKLDVFQLMVNRSRREPAVFSDDV